MSPSDLKNAYSDLHRNTPSIKVVSQGNDDVASDNESVEKEISVTPKYYTIKKGDTLSKIAQKNHTTVSKLCKLNNIKSTSIIREGKRLRVR
ncbi:MAG: LysM peptidoglycan-binding domain-containing protein [Bacteroidales bacterium]|nr:LysM peptidoglycan-binding domain-containing protein [Candidatus Colimorpha pelethequi]